MTRHGSNENLTALDLTNPEALDFAEETLAGLIQRYKLDAFRLDYNTSMGPAGGQNPREGFVENNYWRYYEAVYGMYRRLRKRFPNLMMENCAGGGGRNDLGMLGNFHWTQISDEWGGVRTLKILNGFTIPLPPEYALSYVGFMDDENYRYGDTDFRFRGQNRVVISADKSPDVLFDMLDCLKRDCGFDFLCDLFFVDERLIQPRRFSFAEDRGGDAEWIGIGTRC